MSAVRISIHWDRPGHRAATCPSGRMPLWAATLRDSPERARPIGVERAIALASRQVTREPKTLSHPSLSPPFLEGLISIHPRFGECLFRRSCCDEADEILRHVSIPAHHHDCDVIRVVLDARRQGPNK